MKQSFDYLENVAFAATVCDKEGLVLYQNAVARQRHSCISPWQYNHVIQRS